MSEEKQKLDQDVSSLVNKHAREVSAQGLAGNVKVLSRRALKDIVDNLIKSYGGLEHEELISKIAEYELQLTQTNQKMTGLQGQIELLTKQNEELRARDDELLQAKAVDASRIPMLEEQLETMKKTVSGLEAEKENLARKMDEMKDSLGDEVRQKLDRIDALESELGELRPACEAMQAENAGFQDRLAEREQQMQSLHEQMDQAKARADQDIAERDEHIARLNKALDESDAKKRIAELEKEANELRKTIQLLETGLEFVDVEHDVRPEELLARAGEIRSAGGLPPAMDERLGLLESTLRRDAGDYPPLLEAMYGNQGSIQVACDLAKLLSRQREIAEHIETLGRLG